MTPYKAILVTTASLRTAPFLQQYRGASKAQAPDHEKHCMQVLNVSLRTTKKLFTSKLNIKKTIREAKDASREVHSSLATKNQGHSLKLNNKKHRLHVQDSALPLGGSCIARICSYARALCLLIRHIYKNKYAKSW